METPLLMEGFHQRVCSQCLLVGQQWGQKEGTTLGLAAENWSKPLTFDTPNMKSPVIVPGELVTGDCTYRWIKLVVLKMDAKVMVAKACILSFGQQGRLKVRKLITNYEIHTDATCLEFVFNWFLFV